MSPLPAMLQPAPQPSRGREVRSDTPRLPTLSSEPARRRFRVLTRMRDAYNGGTMFDVQLQVTETGNLVWAQTFSDQREAEEFEAALEADLEELDDTAFRRKYGVPSRS